MIGLHVQTPVNDWTRTLSRFPDGIWIKCVDNVQALDEAKRINPGLKTVLRHWFDGGQIFGTTDQAVLRDRARVFFSTFIDGTFANFAHNVDAVEEWNEYNATSHTGQDLAERVAWADAVSWVWTNEYRNQARYSHIRLVLGSVAIGNDLPWQYAKFAHERNCILGYHPYVPVRDNQVMVGEWDYYSGRWAVMDAAFRERGYTCQWLFTEFGPVGYTPPASLNALDGWRHSTVNGANVDQYLNVMAYWLQRTAAWNKANGNRALGAVLFTTGGGAQWKWFETKQPEIDAITAFMQAWQPPPPPIDPPAPTIRKYKRTVNLLPQNATLQQAIDVIKLAYPNKESVVWSADDSFMNPDPQQAELTGKTAIVWGDVPGGTPQALEAWATLHYKPKGAISYKPWPVPPFEFRAWPSSIRTGGLIMLGPYANKGLNQLWGENPDNYEPFGLPGHEGLDFHLLTNGPVFAVQSGVVELTDKIDDGNYGKWIRVRHANGYTTSYAHLNDVLVTEGDNVQAGQLIGLGGSTGNSSGPHLHLTLKRDGHQEPGGWPQGYVNPMAALDRFLGL